VIVIVLILAIAFVAQRDDSVDKGLVKEDSSGTIYVKVTAALHLRATLTVTLYVDGVMISEGALDAQYTKTWTYYPHFSGEQKSYNIKVTSSGGTYGATSDSATVTVLKGETVNVYLYV